MTLALYRSILLLGMGMKELYKFCSGGATSTPPKQLVHPQREIASVTVFSDFLLLPPCILMVSASIATTSIERANKRKTDM